MLAYLGPLLLRQPSGSPPRPQLADDDIEGASDGEEGEVERPAGIPDGPVLNTGVLGRLGNDGVKSPS